jgi:hypothetical protein
VQVTANPRMKSDAQQRRCAPLFRAAYTHRSASVDALGARGAARRYQGPDCDRWITERLSESVVRMTVPGVWDPEMPQG